MSNHYNLTNGIKSVRAIHEKLEAIQKGLEYASHLDSADIDRIVMASKKQTAVERLLNQAIKRAQNAKEFVEELETELMDLHEAIQEVEAETYETAAGCKKLDALWDMRDPDTIKIGGATFKRTS